MPLPFQPAPDIAEADVNQLLGGSLVQNTLYFYKSSGWLPSDLEALALGLQEWWGSSMKPLLTNRVSLRDVTCKDLTTDSGSVWVQSPLSPLTGTVDEEPVAANVAFCLRLTTGFAGRSNRGRNYVTGFTRLGVNGSAISSGFANSLVSAYNALQGVADDISSSWCILSRYHNNERRPVAVGQLVNGVSYSKLYVSTQRRRIPGVGA